MSQIRKISASITRCVPEILTEKNQAGPGHGVVLTNVPDGRARAAQSHWGHLGRQRGLRGEEQTWRERELGREVSRAWGSTRRDRGVMEVISVHPRRWGCPQSFSSLHPKPQHANLLPQPWLPPGRGEFTFTEYLPIRNWEKKLRIDCVYQGRTQVLYYSAKHGAQS